MVVRPATPRDPARARLIEEVLAELAAHTPPGVVRHLRRWPSGALSLVHLHVLSVLGDEGPLPMRTLAESLDVSQASATGIVDRMEQRGLVERRRDDEDRRIIRVALTDEGTQLMTGVASERRERLTSLLDDLSEEELAALLLGTRALVRAREHLHARLAAEHPDASTDAAVHPGAPPHLPSEPRHPTAETSR